MTGPTRGELWWSETPAYGRRPVVVLSRDDSIEHRRHVLVAPVTRTIRGISTEVVLEPGEDPVAHLSAVNLDSTTELPKAFLTEFLGRLHPARMQQICDALKVAVDCT